MNAFMKECTKEMIRRAQIVAIGAIMGACAGSTDTLRLTGVASSPAQPELASGLQAKPGCYMFIGNGEGDHRDGGHGLGPCVLHNGSYDFNDNLLPVGASFWVRMAEKSLPLAR